MMPQLTADEVRQARTALGLTREAFGAQLGVSAETVRTWESGKRPCSGPAAVLIRRLLA
jgi:DNA-binding transcriptional regulator YiaG